MTVCAGRRAVVGVPSVVVAACGGGAATTSPAAVQRMAMEACAPTGDLVEVAICRCAFDQVADTYAASDLARVDGDLLTGADVPAPVQEAVLDCVADAVRPLTPKQPPPGVGP